ncbi:MAG: ABC transporter ATP-binding protein [Planctomycetota bacterium]
MAGELRETWKLLKPHAAPQTKGLVVVLFLGAILAAVQAAPIALLLPLWNTVLFPGLSVRGLENPASPADRNAIEVFFLESAGIDRLTPYEELAVDDRMAVLTVVAVVAFLLALVAGAAQFFFTWISRRIGFQMIVDLRLRMAGHLMNLSLRYHNQRQLGDLLSRISADVATTLQAIQVALKNFVQQPFFVLWLLGLAFYRAPWPTLGVILCLPILAWPVSRLARKVRRGSTRSLTTLGASVQALSQMFLGVRTVKAFGGEARELERYREINETYMKDSMRMVRHIALTHTWTAFFGAAGLAVLTLVLGVLTIRFGLFGDGADMMVFFGSIMLANNHVKAFAKSLTRVQESSGAATRLRELLAESADVAERPGAEPVEAIREGIRFEGVSFRYPDSDENALSEVDLEIRPGETLALVGASGAGKSTLVDLLARFYDVSEGRITVDGRDLRDLRVADWTRLYATVGQVPFLFHTTIGENVRYGRGEATQAEIEEAARAAYIHDFIAALPEGYDTDVADMGTRLSGGQRQRITIARALLKGAPLLLLDEATSALDSESEAEVQRALDRLMDGRTVLVIAHRLATIQSADRIAVLDAGRVVEVGSHDELLRRRGAYARLWDLQKLGAAE